MAAKHFVITIAKDIFFFIVISIIIIIIILSFCVPKLAHFHSICK